MPPVYFNMATQTEHVARLKSAVTQLRGGIAGLRELHQLMTSMRDGTDYTLIETVFSLEAGRGVVLYNMIGQSISVVDAPDGASPDNRLQMLLKRTF